MLNYSFDSDYFKLRQTNYVVILSFCVYYLDASMLVMFIVYVDNHEVLIVPEFAMIRY